MSRHSLWPVWLSVKWLTQGKRGIGVCSFTLLMSIAVIGGLCLQDRDPPAPCKILRGHKYHIRAAAFSPDAKTLVTGGGLFAEASELIFWDLSIGGWLCSTALRRS